LLVTKLEAGGPDVTRVVAKAQEGVFTALKKKGVPLTRGCVGLSIMALSKSPCFIRSMSALACWNGCNKESAIALLVKTAEENQAGLRVYEEVEDGSGMIRLLKEVEQPSKSQEPVWAVAIMKADRDYHMLPLTSVNPLHIHVENPVPQDKDSAEEAANHVMEAIAKAKAIGINNKPKPQGDAADWWKAKLEALKEEKLAAGKKTGKGGKATQAMRAEDIPAKLDYTSSEVSTPRGRGKGVLDIATSSKDPQVVRWRDEVCDLFGEENTIFAGEEQALEESKAMFLENQAREERARLQREQRARVLSQDMLKLALNRLAVPVQPPRPRLFNFPTFEEYRGIVRMARLNKWKSDRDELQDYNMIIYRPREVEKWSLVPKPNPECGPSWLWEGQGKTTAWGRWGPPPGVNTVWCGGWWPHIMPQGSKPTPFFRPARPTMAAATVENVKIWGDLIYYYPFRATVGVNWQENVVICNGEKQDVFLVGSTVLANKHAFKVEYVPGSSETLIQLVRTERSLLDPIKAEMMVRSGMSRFFNHYRSSTILRSKVDALETVVKRRIGYTVAESLPLTPVEVAALGVAKSCAARGQYGKTTVKAEQSIRYTRDKVAAMKVITGGKPYNWGYCYSCGVDKGGKRMPGRMCSNSCMSDDIVNRLVRAGHHVTTHYKPVVYPGVVETKSMHPPLKKTAKSTVTGDCAAFRPPH
jgi:hypothetical protein